MCRAKALSHKSPCGGTTVWYHCYPDAYFSIANRGQERDQSKLGYCGVLRAPTHIITFFREDHSYFSKTRYHALQGALFYPPPTPHPCPPSYPSPADYFLLPPPPSHSHSIHLLIPGLSGRGPISEVKKWGVKRRTSDATDRKGYP